MIWILSFESLMVTIMCWMDQVGNFVPLLSFRHHPCSFEWLWCAYNPLMSLWWHFEPFLDLSDLRFWVLD